MIADFFQLPPGEHLVEPAGVAVNSKGHIYVFHRGKHPLMEFDSSGVSDNVDPCQTLFERTAPCTPKSAPFRSS